MANLPSGRRDQLQSIVHLTCSIWSTSYSRSTGYNTNTCHSNTCARTIPNHSRFLVDGFRLLGISFFAGGHDIWTPTLGVVYLVVSVAPCIACSPAPQVQHQQQCVRFPQAYIFNDTWNLSRPSSSQMQACNVVL